MIEFFENHLILTFGILLTVFLVAVFEDRFNALCCAILGIGTFFIAANATIHAPENNVGNMAGMWALIVGGWVFFRFLPLIMTALVHKETHTYLILGTLIEETDYTGALFCMVLILIGITLLAGVFAIGAYVLMAWAFSNNLDFVKYIVCGLLTLWGGGSFVKSFFC